MWWTVAAAAIAATTALLIAFVAYPWQKQRDREAQIDLQKRQLYLDFVRLIEKMSAEIAISGEIGRETSEEIGGAMNSLLLLAPSTVMIASVEYYMEEAGYSLECAALGVDKHGNGDSRGNEVISKQMKMIVSMRRDLHVATDQQAKEIEEMLNHFVRTQVFESAAK